MPNPAEKSLNIYLASVASSFWSGYFSPNYWSGNSNIDSISKMHIADPKLPIVPTEPLPNSVGRTPGNSLKSGIRINFIAGTAVCRAKISVDHHSNSAVFSPVSVRHNALAPSSLCSIPNLHLTLQRTCVRQQWTRPSLHTQGQGWKCPRQKKTSTVPNLWANPSELGW